MRLVVGFIFDAFEALGREWVDDGCGQVGDGIGSVLQVQSVTGWVKAVDGGHPVQMILPRLVSVEGVDASSHTSWDMVNCDRVEPLNTVAARTRTKVKIYPTTWTFVWKTDKYKQEICLELSSIEV